MQTLSTPLSEAAARTTCTGAWPPQQPPDQAAERTYAIICAGVAALAQVCSRKKCAHRITGRASHPRCRGTPNPRGCIAAPSHQVLLSLSIHVISDLPCDGNQFIEYRYDIVNSSFPFTQLIASPDHGDPTRQLLASYMYSISVISPLSSLSPYSFAQ